MSEQNRYTAQEMRKVAKCYSCSEVPLGFDKRDVAAMLRQAADAEEENAQLKARLDAVVKIADAIVPLLKMEKKNHECSPTAIRCETVYAVEIEKILRAARAVRAHEKGPSS